MKMDKCISVLNFCREKKKDWQTRRITASIQSSLNIRCSHRALGSQGKRQSEMKHLRFWKFGEPSFKWNPSFLGLHLDMDSLLLLLSNNSGGRDEPGAGGASTSWCECESAHSDAQVCVFPPTRLRTCLPTWARTGEITSEELSPPIYLAHSSPARLRPWVCISPARRPQNNKAHPCLSISQRGAGGVKYAGSLRINN